MLRTKRYRLLVLLAAVFAMGMSAVSCGEDEPEEAIAITADNNIPTYSRLHGFMHQDVDKIVSNLKSDEYEVMNRVNDPVGSTARVEMRKKGAGEVNYYYILTYDRSTKVTSGAEFEYNVATITHSDMKRGILKVLTDDTLFCADQPMEFYSATLRCEKGDEVLCDLLATQADSTIILWNAQPTATVVSLATSATALTLTTANRAVYNSGSLYFTKQLQMR
ncbi:MAG: hypothetical protein IJ761_07180 [Bacteroidales bacterium]|nr:hypothetical protein [Bacteroidales bacterium]